MSREDIILRVKNLSISYKNSNELLVKDISFDLERGKTLAIIGESGSGKSIISNACIGILDKFYEHKNGSVLFYPLAGNSSQIVDVLNIKQSEMSKYWGRSIFMIFQNPLIHLNPLLSISEQMIETLKIHRKIDRKKCSEICMRILKAVGVKDVEYTYNAYPHEINVNDAMRIVFGIAFACEPSLLIYDERTVSLDKSIRIEMMDLINLLKKNAKTSVIFLSQDLSIAAQIADDVMIMFSGRMLEIGRAEEVYNEPCHPYTWDLLLATAFYDRNLSMIVPLKDKTSNRTINEDEDVYARYSKYAMEIDFLKQAPLFKVSDTHYAATWLLHKNAAKIEKPKIITMRKANK